MTEADAPSAARPGLAPSDRLERLAPWLVVGLVAVQLVLLLPLFGRGEPEGSDLTIHYAETAQLVRALRAGDFGLWNPGANLGFASGYYYQILPQLIPALAALALGGSVALLTLFKLAIALPLCLLPATTYRALRVVGADARAALGGAAAVGCVFSLSSWGLGLDSVFIYGLYTQAWGMLFYPLALAYAWRYLGTGQRLGHAVGYVLLTGLCHPFVAVALVPALLAARWWRQPVARLRRAALLGALVLAVSAFFWLPVLVDYTSFGGFPQRGGSEVGMSLHRFSVWLVHGDLLDSGRAPVLTLLLVAAIVVAAHRRSSLLTVLLAQAGIFAALIMLMPILGKTRDDLIPGIRFLAPLQLTLAAAAGIGAVEVMRELWPRARLLPWRAAVIGGAAILGALMLYGSYRQARVRVATIYIKRKMYRDELDQIMALLATRPPGRVMTGNEFRTGDHRWRYLPFIHAGQPSLKAEGGAALQSSPNFVYLLAPGRATETHTRLYNVRYLLARRDKTKDVPADARPILTTEHCVAFELPAPGYFGPIRITGSVPEAREQRVAAVLAWLAGPGPEAGEHLVIGDGQPPGPPPQGRVLSEREAPSRYGAEVEVTGTTPTTFLVRVSYHPRWSATIDGQPAAIQRVSPDMMAVDVPPGRHDLALAFYRPGWSWALMAITLAVLLGLGLRARMWGWLVRLRGRKG